MSGAKETPRQKMIGMLYLVLLAMLALNVSKMILDSFVTVNAGLKKTNVNFNKKNSIIMDAFHTAMLSDPVKTKPILDKANNAVKYSNNLYKEIHDIKTKLYMEVQRLPKAVADTIKLSEIEGIDNYDVPTHILIGSDPGAPIKTPGSGNYLKKQLIQYREKMLNLLQPADRKSVDIGLRYPDHYSKANGKESWEAHSFYHSTLAAAVTILTQQQNNIRNAEATILDRLYTSISAKSYKFDALVAKVIPASNYIQLGDTFKADVFLAAYSTTKKPKIIVGDVDSLGNLTNTADTTDVPVENGIGKYIVKPKKEGMVDWSGIIKMKTPDGIYKSYPFHSEYIVAKPSVVVSPTKMNVFYIGVNNPVAISVPGVAASQLSPSISNGSIVPHGGDGNYIVHVRGGSATTVTVYAKTKDGKRKSMGPGVKFRVKSVPDPEAFVMGKTGQATITKAQLLAAPGVYTKMKDFDFDLKFQVVSFDVSMAIHGAFSSKPSNGNRMSSAQKTMLRYTQAGSRVFIEHIKVRGPDGRIRQISSINLKVL